MKCYQCGEPLTGEDVCPKCGAQLKQYRMAVHASNAWYNLGLQKAQVRNLSGAAESLVTSLSIDKKNIEARNLLGLVLLEMGNTVEALSQWVISKNIQPRDNVASEYITEIQSNQNRFEVITKSIQKYNKALEYAKEKNYDMAVIQLKKIISVNPKLIKAQLLLALLYMRQKDFSRAKKTLKAVLAADRNNTTALRYIREIQIEENARKKAPKDDFLPRQKIKEREIAPLSGNDVIMPRNSYKEPSNGAVTVINILTGVVIGAAMIWFLIIPAKYRGMTQDYNLSIQEYSEKLSTSNVELNNLQRQVDEITAERDRLAGQVGELAGEGGTNRLLSALINSANAYIANDIVASAEALKGMDVSALPSEASKTLYNTLASSTMTNAAASLYNMGLQRYNARNMAEAADYMKRSYELDSTRADAAYYAAKAYDAANDNENALKYFRIIVDNFPRSGYFAEASAYVGAH